MEATGNKNNTPTWLDGAFIEKALNSGNGSKIQVINSEITRATNFGDNYASDIYRIKVLLVENGEEHTKSFIIKTALTSGEIGEMVSEFDAFSTEINAYTLVFKFTQNLLEEALLERYQPFAAKCFYTSKGPPAQMLVLEDLKEQGFRLAEKPLGLDLNHCLLVMRNLARYHATSVILHEKDPDKLEPFKIDIPEGLETTLKKFYSPMITQIADEIQTWPDFKERFAEKIYKLADTAIDHVIDGFRYKEEEEEVFKVLSHSDLWSNNMMFKYVENTDEVVDVRFLDFQGCRWVSPGTDLQYFLNGSTTIDVMENSYHDLLEEYYKTLRDTFTELGFKELAPSKEQILKQYEKAYMFGIVQGLLIRTVIFADPGKKPDFDKIIRNDSRLPLSDRYKDALKIILPLFERRGWK